MKRLSRGTPHILTTGEVESVLATVKNDPVLEQAIAEVYGMTVEDWRKQKPAVQAKHIIDTQEHGRLSAVLAGSLKARRDLLGESIIVKDDNDPQSLRDDLRLMQAQMQMVLDRLAEIDPGPRTTRNRKAV